MPGDVGHIRAKHEPALAFVLALVVLSVIPAGNLLLPFPPTNTVILSEQNQSKNPRSSCFAQWKR
jgi:hypothetical protein